MTAPNPHSDELYRAQLLKRRAEALARRDDAAERRDLVETAVVLQVGGERFGVQLGALSEIVPLTETAEMPGLPPWLLGVTQVRGKLLSVLDLAQWFNVSSPSKPRYLVVLEGPGGSIAALVDAIVDIIQIHADDLSTTLAFDDATGRGAITKDLVTLIDVNAMLASPRMIVDQSKDEAEGGG